MIQLDKGPQFLLYRKQELIVEKLVKLFVHYLEKHLLTKTLSYLVPLTGIIGTFRVFLGVCVCVCVCVCVICVCVCDLCVCVCVCVCV